MSVVSEIAAVEVFFFFFLLLLLLLRGTSLWAFIPKAAIAVQVLSCYTCLYWLVILQEWPVKCAAIVFRISLIG